MVVPAPGKVTVARRARRATVAAVTIATLGLSGCVTNVEKSTPDGWEPIRADKVDEIAAMYDDDDGVLSIGVNPPFAPFQLKDADGQIVGLEMDLVHAVADVLGLDFRIEEQDFAMILPAVQSGQIDMGVSGFTDTPDRRENFDFVDTLYAGIQWTKRTDSSKEIDPHNPCGLTVAVQRTTVSDTDDVRPKAEACDGDMQVLAYDTADNAALAVLMGRADALSADSPAAGWAVNRADGRLELVGDISQAAPYGMAVPRGSELGLAAAAALQHLIDNGQYAEILAQWGVEDGLVDEALINERPVK